jgi:2-keto-4-pentenoate hydratase
MPGGNPHADAVDPRIVRGMAEQFRRRGALTASGGRPLGWKVGFGAPAALTQLGIRAPLVGFLMAEGRIRSGEGVSVAGWTKPVVEPEIAIHMGRDLPGGSGSGEAKAAIAGLGAALELANVDGPTDDVQQILAGNIFHRGVILGEIDRTRSGARLDGLAGRLFRRGIEVAAVDDLERNTGRLLDIVAHVANALAACGERLKADQVIIAGSVTPPIFVDGEDTEIRFDLGPSGSVSVNLL